MTCTLTTRPDGVVLRSPYDPAFVAAFKALLRNQDRAWDAHHKVWVIHPTKAKAVADLCYDFFGQRPDVPDLSPPTIRSEIKTITLEYLGQCKRRGDGEPTALGFADGAWRVVAPESVLRAWFDPFGVQCAQDDSAPSTHTQTLYGVLGVDQSADEAQIKQGYRRMARQWHPDTCREPDAHAMFVTIKAAYDVLSDPLKRRKYNAGLAFEAMSEQATPARQGFALAPSYRAPLRCGLIVAECMPTLGRLMLTKILVWHDITDTAGRVMVSSWDRDAERIKVQWVQP